MEPDGLRGMLDDLNEYSMLPPRTLDFLDAMLLASEDPFWCPSQKQEQYIIDLHRRYIQGD